MHDLSRSRLVLILETSPTIRTLLEVQLTRIGWQVQAFALPEELLQCLYLRPVPPPLAVIFNLQLRGATMDGYEVARLIRTEAPLAVRHLPLLALTTIGPSTVPHNVQQSQITHYLPWPCPMQEIIATLASL